MPSSKTFVKIAKGRKKKTEDENAWWRAIVKIAKGKKKKKTEDENAWWRAIVKIAKGKKREEEEEGLKEERRKKNKQLEYCDRLVSLYKKAPTCFKERWIWSFLKLAVEGEL